MADKTLSSVIGSGGGGGLIMPLAVSNTLFIGRGAGATGSTSGAANFWVAVDLSKTGLGWESVSLSATADTTEQTIIDTTGEGVLTHVVAPALSSSGVMTIRVTVDGALTTYTSPTLAGANTDRFLTGAFAMFGAVSVATNSAGIGTGTDAGYSITQTNALLTSAPQAITEKGIGQVFKTSLKVTIQGSVNITATAEMLKAAVCYTNYIPEGL